MPSSHSLTQCAAIEVGGGAGESNARTRYLWYSCMHAWPNAIEEEEEEENLRTELLILQNDFFFSFLFYFLFSSWSVTHAIAATAKIFVI